MTLGSHTFVDDVDDADTDDRLERVPPPPPPQLPRMLLASSTTNVAVDILVTWPSSEEIRDGEQSVASRGGRNQARQGGCWVVSELCPGEACSRRLEDFFFFVCSGNISQRGLPHGM